MSKIAITSAMLAIGFCGLTSSKTDAAAFSPAPDALRAAYSLVSTSAEPARFRGGAAAGRRGGMAVGHGRVVAGPRGAVGVRRGAVVGPRGNVAVRRAVVARPYRPWVRRAYYGTVIGGVALGTIIAASAVPAAPAPNTCWYWADQAQTQGYWDYCRR